jgi:hypothetical protein
MPAFGIKCRIVTLLTLHSGWQKLLTALRKAIFGPLCRALSLDRKVWGIVENEAEYLHQRISINWWRLRSDLRRESRSLTVG